MVTLAELICQLESIAPPELAYEDDHIGLQVGDPKSEIGHACVSVDASARIVEKAIDAGADVLISHHPLIHAPLLSVAETDPLTGRVAKLIRANCASYVLHTNFDAAPGGVNDVLAEELGVRCTGLLSVHRTDPVLKIVTFVPEEAVEEVRDAMAEAGAGRIGQYTHCSFRTEGTGSFVPLPAAKPYIGTIGSIEEVREYRLEMLCAGSWRDAVLDAMIEKHPYDEVAYDVIELANDPIEYGVGRVGNLASDTTLAQFADLVKERLDPEYLKVFGDPDMTIRTVAMCGGGGSSLWKDAVRAGADVYVTGDMGHHQVSDATELGLAIIDAGHFHTERPGMKSLAERLGKTYAASGVHVEYIE